MNSPFSEEPGAGVFVHFEGEPFRRRKLCLALVEDLLENFGFAERDVQIAVNKRLDWRSFSWAAIEKAIANPDQEEVRVLVGTAEDVQLTASMQLRHWLWLTRRFDDPEGWRRYRPPGMWIIGRCSRWPPVRMRALAYRWFRTAAKLGRPIAGGATANPSSHDLYNDISPQRAGAALPPGAIEPVSSALFQWFLSRDRNERMHERIRRLYPVSLLGPRFSTPRNAQLLRTAGAEVEDATGSLVVTTYPELVYAWDPAYMGATAALRKLGWPISIQNPIDYEGLGKEHWFKLDPKPGYDWQPTPAQLRAAMTAFREAVAATMPPVVPRDGLEFAPGCEPEPLPPEDQQRDFTENLSPS